MNKRIALVAFVLVVGAGAIYAVHLSSGSSPAESENPETAAAATGSPRVVLDAEEHDFGDLQHEEQVSHTFRIFNQGDGPLRLQRGPTTCKCTMSTLPEQEIAPGQGAEIILTSKVVERRGFFSHSATIFTNDPRRPVLTLKIIGAIRETLAAKPNEVTLAGTLSGKVFDVLVFSQVWDRMKIVAVDSGIEGLRWEELPPEPKSLRENSAVSGRRLRFTLPESFSGADLHDSLIVRAVHAEQPEAVHQTVVELRGEVRRDEVGLFGEKMYTGRILRLGTLLYGKGAKETLVLKFRGQDRPVRIKEICAKPGFVQVSVRPFQPDQPDNGLFRIDIVIPPETPACDHMGVRMGEVLIETDHPTRPTVKFQIEFSILSTPRA